MNQRCPQNGCSTKLQSKRHARNHYKKHHSGTAETPDEYLERVESEQRDFDGYTPSTEGHDPEYLSKNETPETRRSTLFEHERNEDSILVDHTDKEDESE